MKKNSIKLSIIALAALSLFSGCKRVQNNKVVLALDWTPNTNHTGFYVAQAKGFYEAEGLNVEITQPSENGSVMMAVNGSAQFGIDFQDTMAPVFANKEDFPIVTVAALLQHNTSGIVSLKKTGIDRPGKMENHNYATWDSPIELSILRSMVEADGGDFNKVELIPSTVYDVVTALNTDVDSVWIYYAWDGIVLQQKGIENNYIDIGQQNPAFDYYTPVLVSNTNYLKKNTAQAKAFLRATKKGYEYAIEHPEEAAEILCAAAPELDKDIVLASQKWINNQYKAEVSPWGYIDPVRWGKFYDYLNDSNILEEKIDISKTFTNEYLD